MDAHVWRIAYNKVHFAIETFCVECVLVMQVPLYLPYSVALCDVVKAIFALLQCIRIGVNAMYELFKVLLYVACAAICACGCFAISCYDGLQESSVAATVVYNVLPDDGKALVASIIQHLFYQMFGSKHLSVLFGFLVLIVHFVIILSTQEVLSQ